MNFNKYILLTCLILTFNCFNLESQNTIILNNENVNHQIDGLITQIKLELKAGKLLEALSLCDSANSIAIINNLAMRQNEILIYRGNAFQLMGFISEALELFISAQKQLETGGTSEQVIDLYYYVALLYFDIGNIIECHKYLRMAVKVRPYQNSPNYKFPIYMMYANSFVNQDSISYYLQSAKNLIDNNPSMIFEKVVLLNNLAYINEVLENLEISQQQYLEAIEISKKNNFNNYLSTLYNNYAYLLMAQSNYDSSKYYLDQALDISIEIKSLDMESEIYDSYSDYYERIGDFKNAHIYSGLFIEKRDQYREQQQIQKSLFLSAVFDTEQKEKDILLKEKDILQKENKINNLGIYLLIIVIVLIITIGFVYYNRYKYTLTKSRMETMEKEKSLEIADAVIHGQDDERKRLAMDLHDGLGARLGALRFLVDDAIPTDNKYDEIVGSILDIHQNVRNISHRMQPPELEKYGLNKAITNLVNTIDSSSGFEVEFEFDLESRHSKKIETHIYFLVYELINNAIKHSNGNNIFIQLLQHEDEIFLSVEDNGSGFHYDESLEGMGLKNIRSRVSYLNASISIESTGVDTSIMIEIPV